MMTSRVRSLLCAATLLSAGSAVAADRPLGSDGLPPAPELPALFSWSGVYVGVQAGYSWGSDRLARATAAGLPLSTTRYDTASAVGGAHIGANHQFGQFVIGAEADLEAREAGGRDPFGAIRPSRDWQGSVRGRLGYALDRFMIYASAGIAFTQFDYGRSGAGTLRGGSVDRSGWTVGGGASLAMTDHVILGVDYRYTDFGRFGVPDAAVLPAVVAEQRPTEHTVRASLGYKF